MEGMDIMRTSIEVCLMHRLEECSFNGLRLNVDREGLPHGYCTLKEIHHHKA